MQLADTVDSKPTSSEFESLDAHMTKINLTEIVVILDRSGSMSNMVQDVKGGFDKFVEEQSNLPGECLLTLVQFDTGAIETVYSAKDIRKVGKLELIPRGGTPLLDAIGKTINDVGGRLRITPEASRPERVLVLIITDGEENSSREFTKTKIKELVEHQSGKYQWEFMYLGANVDAFSEAVNYGILVANASNYTPQTSKKMFGAVSLKAASYRSGGTVAFTPNEQKDLETP